MPRCNSEILKNLRRKAKLSQNALARKAEVDRGTVSNAENSLEVAEMSVVKIVSALAREIGEDVTYESVLVQA